MADNHNIAEPLELKITSSIDKTDTNLTKVATALEKLKTSAVGLGTVQSALADLAKGFTAIGSTDLRNTASSINSLKNAIPKLATVLKELKFDELTTGVNNFVTAMGPLVNTMSKVSSQFSGLPSNVRQYSNALQSTQRATDSLNKSTNGLGSVLKNSWVKMAAMVVIARRVGRVFSGLLHSANMYIENLNLFTVTMGNATQAALDYADAVSEAVGIDPAEWIRHVGIFKQIAGGFGVAEDRANLMSKNLTQLVYDTASFFNTTVEESAQKFEAGLAQQSRPLRRFGYDISMTALREEALAMGIQQTVDTMTRAEKAQLTYIVMMKQSKNIMGDMARTVITPANALRILNMQWDMTKRTLGNAIIPLVQTLVPYFVALAQAIRHVANSLAALAGFQMPEIDYSKMGTDPVEHLEDAFNNLGDSIGGATSKVKEFKNFVMGFDELHIIPTPSSGGGGGGLDEFGDLFKNLELPQYDFLAQLAPMSKKIEEIREKLISVFEWLFGAIKTLLPLIQSVGIYLVAAFVGQKVLRAFTNFLKYIKLPEAGIATFANKVKGVGSVVGGAFIAGFTGFVAGKLEAQDILSSFQSRLATGLGGAIGGSIIAKGLIALGASGPIGWGVGLLGGAALALWGYLKGVRTETEKINREATFNSFFGEIRLTNEELNRLVDTLTTTDFSVRVRAYSNARADLELAVTDLDSALHELNRVERLIQIGAEVELGEYKTAIDDYFVSVNNYMKTRKLALELAVNVVFGSDSTLGSSVLSDQLSWHTEQTNELLGLEKQITRMVEQAYKDGISAVDLSESIDELLTKHKELVSALQQFEADVARETMKIRLQLSGDIGAKFGMSELDFENWQDVVSRLSGYYSEILSETASASALILNNAKMKYGEDSEEYRAFVDLTNRAMYTEILNDFAELQVDFYDSGFLAVLNNALPTGLFPTDMDFTTSFLKPGHYVGTIKAAFEGIDATTVEYATKLYTSVLPIIIDQTAALEGALEAGATIPDAFYDEYRKHMTVAAIAGDIKAQYFLIGEEMSKSSSYMELLKTVEGSAKDIPTGVKTGILSNLSVIKDAMGRMQVVTRDGVKYDLTPEFLSNLYDMGWAGPLEIQQALLDSWTTASPSAQTNAISLFYDKVFNNLDYTKYGKVTYEGVRDILMESFNNVGQYSDYPDFIQSIIDSQQDADFKTFFKDYKSEIIKFIEDAKKESDKFSNYFQLKSQTLTVSQTVSGVKVDVKTFGGMTYATGGFPTAGEFFMANEYGNVEMVGKQGTRSMVANNMQIIEGISHGVVEGMVMAAAITGDKDTSDSGDTLVIQVGGQTIYTATMAEAKRQAQRSGKAAIVVR